MSTRAAFFTGARDMLPIVLGGIPFGLIAGVSARQIGLLPIEATAVSAVIFAGAAQLASYELLSRDVPLVVVLFTAVVINLRLALYSAAIAPTFVNESRARKLVCAYLLTDQAYVLTAARNARTPGAEHGVAYYLGGAGSLWTMWIVCTLIGAVAGAAIPPTWSLDFAAPLCFVALLIPALRDRTQVVAALATGAASLALLNVPYGSGVILSVGVGMIAGVGFDRWRQA